MWGGLGRGHIRNKQAFILIEAIASVVVVSVSLVLIAQSLLTNLRTGRDFQNHTRLILVLENQLGLFLAASSLGPSQSSTALLEPYKDLTVKRNISPLEGPLSLLDISVGNMQTKRSHVLQVSTLAYVPKQ